MGAVMDWLAADSGLPNMGVISLMLWGIVAGRFSMRPERRRRR